MTAPGGGFRVDPAVVDAAAVATAAAESTMRAFGEEIAAAAAVAGGAAGEGARGRPGRLRGRGTEPRGRARA